MRWQLSVIQYGWADGSELMVVCACHSDEVMREADANDTSGELGSALPGSLVGESVFRTAKLEILTESAR